MTKLSLSNYDAESAWECERDDVSIDELVSAFAGLCISHTFLPEQVNKAFESYLRKC